MNGSRSICKCATRCAQHWGWARDGERAVSARVGLRYRREDGPHREVFRELQWGRYIGLRKHRAEPLTWVLLH